MVNSIEFWGIPVALLMIYSSGAVVRDNDPRDTAEVFKHVNVCCDPRFLLFIYESLGISILAVGASSYKDPCISNLTVVRIDDVSRISGPVDFHLLSRFSWDMHGGTAFLLILLDVIAELRVHERLLIIHTAHLAVLCPKKLFGYTVAKQFLTNVRKVWHRTVSSVAGFILWK